MVATIQELEDKYLATLKGELNTAAAVEVENVLKPLYKSDGRDVEIDCTELAWLLSFPSAYALRKKIPLDSRSRRRTR